MNQNITIRKSQPDDDHAVWEVAKTLEILDRYLAYLSYKRSRANALVAVDDEKIVGCIVPRIATIDGEKIGSVDWVFVDRNVQGRGIGKALVDAALLYFQDRGCKTLYALVDRYNSQSWNMFLHRGFMPFEFDRQFKVFGLRVILLWWVVSFFIAPGHSILQKTDKEDWLKQEEALERWHYLLAWLGSSFITWVVGFRYDVPLFASIPFVLGVVGISIFIHELTHKLIARLFGLKTIFKANELGLVFSALFSPVFGGFYPSYGSTYINQKDWFYNKNPIEMRLVYTAGPIISMGLALCFLGLIHWADNEWLKMLGTIGFWTNFSLGFFNLFPAPMFDGDKMFLGAKTVWILLMVMGLILLKVVSTLAN